MASEYYFPEPLKRCELEVEVVSGNLQQLMDAWQDAVYFMPVHIETLRDPETWRPSKTLIKFVSIGRPYAQK